MSRSGFRAESATTRIGTTETNTAIPSTIRSIQPSLARDDSILVFPIKPDDLNAGGSGRQQQHEPGDGGGPSEFPVAESYLVEIDREDLRGLERSALRQYPDSPESAHGDDDAEDGGD